MDFTSTLRSKGIDLKRLPLEIIQVNVGKLCNQTCHHCHVDAGPKRREIMDERTASRVIELIEAAPSAHTVDITGGAPELNPNFKLLVLASRQAGKRVIDRCNLTVLLEPGQEKTARFLADNRVEITASLPCYLEENVDEQRGSDVFRKSIEVLRFLNALGYGMDDAGLVLNLVYNPLGPALPPDQAALESDYKRELAKRYDIAFNRLFTITNMPINRFARQLAREGKHEEYMRLLTESFNPATAEGVMCRNLVSIGWDGKLYDCDFNQMLALPAARRARTIWEIDGLAALEFDPIAFADHCYGCTAGAGSSCGGAIAN
jgi:radical SAM/Cys-rich protein